MGDAHGDRGKLTPAGDQEAMFVLVRALTYATAFIRGSYDDRVPVG
jgi:hypothetical protein